MIDELTEFAAAEFVLSDNNLRSQLEYIERETGKRPAQLDSGGVLPSKLEHVWVWYLELSGSRTEYRPFNHTELLSFFRLHEIEPNDIELTALKRLDREWILHKANTLDSKKG